jgi:sugar phosphate isomerase/epimerase
VADPDPRNAGKPFSMWGNHRDPVGPSNFAATLPRLKSLVANAGLEVSVFSPYTRVTDPAGFDVMANAAAQVGAPMVRVTAPGYDGKRPYADLLRDSMAGLEAIEGSAGRRGVKAVIEIHHGTIAPSASAVRRMLEGRDPSRVGAILDPGNMLHEGHEDWPKALDILGPYLAHVHAKNAVWVLKDRPAGGPWRWEATNARVHEGIADWAAILGALKAARYAGWVSLEDLTDQPADAKLANTLDFLKPLA